MVEVSVLATTIIGISTVLAKAFPLNAKFIPLVNLVLGVLFTIAFVGVDKNDILNGIIAGLTASGLFSSSKNISEGVCDLRK